MRTFFLLIIGACLATSACDVGTNASGRSDARPPVKGDISLSLETTVVSARVRAGATLAAVLRTHAVAVSEASAIVAQAGSVFDLRKVRANQPYRLETTHTGTMRGFEYEIDGDRFLRVGRSPDDALVARVLPIPKTRGVEVVTGRIDRAHASLVAALDAAGETIDLTLALADIFGGDIDFTTEVQPGDHFELTVEKQFRDNHQFAGYGPILAAEFTNAGRRVRALRFTPEGGSPGYYDEHGGSMRRFFLASPLKFQPVVTSGFSRARLHPVLREVRAHLGVDYRAPAGAPVVAVADGVVVSAGDERRRRPHGAPAPRQRLRDRVSASVGARGARGRPRPAGRAHRTRRLVRPRDGGPSRLSPQEKRRVHQPGHRASRDAARRSDSGGADGRLRRPRRDRAMRRRSRKRPAVAAQRSPIPQAASAVRCAAKAGAIVTAGRTGAHRCI